ncbi:hypothetical protein BU24DRAFT_33643 [Aaosphaeria arxii CBS 175.79]|uniref:Uncharacterized protein n=1 Tax=Aaosphaeria arxii CBS 175.79 TaxID=1450172 RepID=A0A6A5YB18_9PLEO|nr:uncharacterized protein BU24DRAFT_33643 [Aaosphaeria arxii CBS 175.79]KAF2021970.1 hypothetical protein BU24DRAFT_33643 [Aaosphaeria arxii CBS 175.79]
MGSAASKGARAAGASARKYPTRVPPTATTTTTQSTTSHAPAPPPPSARPSQAGPTVHPSPQASETKTQAIDLDARDPAFASRLNTIGVVEPNPYHPSTSSSFDPSRRNAANQFADMMTAPPQSAFPDPGNNPALRILHSRQKIQEEAESELEQLGKRGFKGRTYVDAGILQLALKRLQRGESEAKVEDAFDIKRGRLGLLKKGLVESV